MIERLQEYVFGDPRPRRIRDRFSILVALAWFIFLTAMKHGPSEAMIQSIALLIACQIITTWWYCRPQSSVGDVSEDQVRRERYTLAAGFASVIVSVLVSRPNLQAAVIAARLRRIIANPGPHAIKNASSLLSIASNDRLLLPKQPIEQIVTKRVAISDVLKQILQTIDQEAVARGIKLPLVGLIIWKKTQTEELVINGLSGEGAKFEQFQVRSEAGSLVPAEMVAFFAPIGTRITSPVNEGAAYIRVQGGHIAIPLDGMHFKNLIFVDCILVYSGKSLRAENSGFFNCQFRFSENLACQRLAEKILATAALTYSSP